MFIIILLALLTLTIFTLVLLIKDKKACSLAKKQVQEMSSYTVEHIQSLELEGVSVADELEVAKVKHAKFKKKTMTKAIILAVLVVLLVIVI